ncbi:MAG: FAD-dependent oxidoreductase [Ignavibacteria bacterium]|nr:FAD-dependent oxidoreductase [Ignavibacteria bacterium]
MNDFIIKLTGKKLICENTLLFTFDRSGTGYNYFPGQYAYFTLPENTENLKIDVKGNTRPFSFAGSPDKKDLLVAVRKNESAFVENLLNLKPGSDLFVSRPFGNNILADNSEKIFIAGGIGITPVRSILEYVYDNDLNEKITLFYFNKSCPQTAFLSELEKWSENIKGFKFIPVIADLNDKEWNYVFGLFSAELIKKYAGNTDGKNFYLFGSDSMNEIVKETILREGVKPENIITESAG